MADFLFLNIFIYFLLMKSNFLSVFIDNFLNFPYQATDSITPFSSFTKPDKRLGFFHSSIIHACISPSASLHTSLSPVPKLQSVSLMLHFIFFLRKFHSNKSLLLEDADSPETTLRQQKLRSVSQPS